MISDIDIFKAKILIVDDNEESVRLLEKILEKAGYTYFLGITDSRDTIDLYQSFEPDLILLDINMPYFDGYEVMDELKKIKGDDYLPILIITAQKDEATRLRSLEAGAKDFLTKPFHWSEVMARIRNILEVRLLHNKLRDQNKVLARKIEERTRELYESRLETISSLGLASEYKDNETGYHIMRMSRMSSLLGSQIGLSKPKTDLIRQASPMHDIGKIGIPDHILLKPGKLKSGEWETMKSHTTIGAKMLSKHSSQLMQMAKEIAYTHHERWNGTGYPNGLKEDQIPLTGRICAITDVFDSLTSKKSYKTAWSIGDSMKEIEDKKGIYFDPNLVDAFKNSLDGMVDIKNEYREPV